MRILGLEELSVLSRSLLESLNMPLMSLSERVSLYWYDMPGDPSTHAHTDSHTDAHTLFGLLGVIIILKACKLFAETEGLPHSWPVIHAHKRSDASWFL